MLFTVLGLAVLLFYQFVNVKDKAPSQEPGTKDAATAKPGKLESASGENTLKVAVSLTPDEFELLKSMSDKYAAEHNSIAISLENMPREEQYGKLKQASTLGEAPDIMLLDNSWVGEFAALGFLHPLDEFVSSDQQAKFLPSAMKLDKWNGYLWGIPKDVDPYILVWNKKLAADNKWDHPPNNKEEMAAWNKALLKPDEGMYGIYFDPHDYMAFVSMYSAVSGLPAEEGNPLQKAPDAAVLKLLQAFLVPQEVSWNAKRFAKNYPEDNGKFNPWDLITKGKMAGIVTTVSEYLRHSGGEVAWGALPITGSGKTSGSWLKARSFCLSSRSANKPAAMDWINRVTASEAQDQAWVKTGKQPALVAGNSSAPLSRDEQYASFASLVREGKVPSFAFDAANRQDIFVREGKKLAAGEIDLKAFADMLAKP
jgi:maltose-binding protein MalE